MLPSTRNSRSQYAVLSWYGAFAMCIGQLGNRVPGSTTDQAPALLGTYSANAAFAAFNTPVASAARSAACKTSALRRRRAESVSPARGDELSTSEASH